MPIPPPPEPRNKQSPIDRDKPRGAAAYVKPWSNPVREEKTTGIRCPSCHCRDGYVQRTTSLPNGHVRRRRICRNCGTGFYTSEVPESHE